MKFDGEAAQRVFDNVQPPGPLAQQINRWIHFEPWNSIIQIFYWSFLFCFVFPIIGSIMLTLMPLKIIWQLFIGERTIYSALSSSSSTSKNYNLGIVITGCDSGFGYDLAIALAKKSTAANATKNKENAGTNNNIKYTIFAGCLKKESFSNFASHSNIVPVQVDVTKNDEVQGFSKIVQGWLERGDVDEMKGKVDESTTVGTTKSEEERYLHAVISNAGIAKGGLIDLLEIDDYQKIMDVNCFGILRVVKAFLPILKQQRILGRYVLGRFINMTSMAGRGVRKNLSTYQVSKHAAQALSMTLYLEMQDWDIPVVTVNPTYHTTRLVKFAAPSARKFWEQDLSDEARMEYGQDFYIENILKLLALALSRAWDADVVCKQLVHLVELKRPPPECIIGSDGKFRFTIINMLPPVIKSKLLALILPGGIKPAALQNGTKAAPVQKMKDT